MSSYQLGSCFHRLGSYWSARGGSFCFRSLPKCRPHQLRCLMAEAAAKPFLKGVVFDMDGTLTVPVIDFDLMRKRVGVTEGDILDYIKGLPDDEQTRAFEIIGEMEKQALIDLQVMPGAVELCSYLDERGVPRGLLTRNVKASVEVFHDRYFPLKPFSPAVSRECGFPYKPSPDALLHICDVWGISPAECLMVGDSAKDDVVCGRRANAATILLDPTGKFDPPEALQGETVPTFKVRSLCEVASLLEHHYSLRSPWAREG